MRNKFEYLTPPAKLGLAALFAFLSLIVTLILSAIISIPIFGIDAFLEISSSNLSIEGSNVAILKFIQLAQTIGLFIIPTFFLAFVFSSNFVNYLSIDKAPKLNSIVIVVLIAFAVSPVISVFGQWNATMELPSWLGGVEEWMKKTESDAKVITDLFLNTNNIGGLLVNIFIIAVIPALGEELLFRGVIQKIFLQWFKNPHLAVWVSAILFSALHFQFYGFVPRALLGALFGYFLIWSGNLWLPIIAHFVNNAAAVIAFYLYENKLTGINPDEIGTGENQWVIVIVFTTLTLFLLKILKNKTSSIKA